MGIFIGFNWLLYFVSSLAFYANSKHFSLPQTSVKNLLSHRGVNIAIGILSFIVATYIDIHHYGLSTGLVIAMMAMMLMTSALILWTKTTDKGLYWLSSLIMIITLIKIIYAG